MPGKPWHSKDRLYRAYIEEDKTQSEIADEWGCHQGTISTWLNKHGIEKSNPWDDEERLRELYHGEMLSSREIGDRLGASGTTIRRALRRHDIEVRERSKAHQLSMWKGPASFQTAPDGYEVAHTTIDTEKKHVYIHRLLAVAEYGYEAIKDKDVHHKNGVKWDNRPENIDIMSRSEHKSHHAEETDGYIGKNLHLVE